MSPVTLHIVFNKSSKECKRVGGQTRVGALKILKKAKEYVARPVFLSRRAGERAKTTH